MSKKLILFIVLFVFIGVTVLTISAAAQEKQPEIYMWAKTGAEGDALEKAAYVYTRETGNPVKVLVIGRSGFRQKYSTALAAGSTDVDGILDIARLIPGFAAGGMIIPLDDYIYNTDGYNPEDISPSVIALVKYDGKLYMAPTDISMETMFYNKDIIETPPATWEELREMAKKYTRALNPDSPTEYGYAFPGMAGNVIGTILGVQHGYGAQIIDENGCVKVDSPEFITALSTLTDMKNVDGTVPPDVTAWDYQEILVALQESIVPMADFFNAGMPDLSNCDLSPDVCESIVMDLQPAGPEGSYSRVNPLGFMINAASPRKDATWEFVKWLTGPEGAKIYTQMGGSSPRISVFQDIEVLSERPWMTTFEKVGSNGVGNLMIAQAPLINDTFNKWADQAIAGDMTAEEALKSCAAELREALKESENAACKK